MDDENASEGLCFNTRRLGATYQLVEYCKSKELGPFILPRKGSYRNKVIIQLY